MLDADAIQIWRSDDGDYHMRWRTAAPDTPVTVEPLDAPEPVEAHYHPEPGARVRGLPRSRRDLFRLRDQLGSDVVAGERRVYMQGTPNLRDVGGYPAADGRRVKWGHLFRSGQLSSLSDEDVARLAHLRLDLVCDFRREEEQTMDPSRLPEEATSLRRLSLPITPGSQAEMMTAAWSAPLDRAAMFDFMLDINRDLALRQGEAFRAMFAALLAAEDGRMLVHCAAGKDRTGFAIALILLALGVPDEVVMADYLLSARYFSPQAEIDRLRQKYQMESLAAEAILPMLEVHPQYLAAALDAIRQRYPDIHAYLEAELGVGPDEVVELRRRYLD
jgi:protein-tyrosine phosphatase